MRHRWHLLRCGIVACLLQACTPAPSSRDATSHDTCVLLPGTASVTGTVLVGLTDDVVPARAPLPSNASEHLLFAHFYETLTRIDCAGRVVPGLAESWRAVHGGLEWEFTLRAGARFWDGSPVTAADVVACWRAVGSRHQAERVPCIDLVAANERRLVVACPSPRPDLPRDLARPEGAVTKPADFSGWPVGTGPHRPSGPSAVDADGRSRTLTAYPTRPGAWTVLRFLLTPGATAQQLLDAGVDLLISDDAEDLVSAEPEFVAVPLPWATVYAVLCVTRSARDRLAAALPLPAREALARDVVRGSRGAAEPPPWWAHVDACAVGFHVMFPHSPLEERIVYPQHDTRARALAERIVALGLLAPRAQGLEAQSFGNALGGGRDAAYVVALPRFAASPCREAQAFLTRAPWLLQKPPRQHEAPDPTANSAAASSLALAMYQHILALVETRPALVARRGLVGIGLAGDGMPRLEGVGWEKSGVSP